MLFNSECILNEVDEKCFKVQMLIFILKIFKLRDESNVKLEDMK